MSVLLRLTSARRTVRALQNQIAVLIESKIGE